MVALTCRWKDLHGIKRAENPGWLWAPICYLVVYSSDVNWPINQGNNIFVYVCLYVCVCGWGGGDLLRARGDHLWWPQWGPTNCSAGNGLVGPIVVRILCSVTDPLWQRRQLIWLAIKLSTESSCSLSNGIVFIMCNAH